MLIWMTAVMLAGPASAVPAQAQPDVNKAPCVDVDVRGTRDKANRARRFRASTVGDLELVVSYGKRPSGIPVELRVYTPEGHLYQVLRVPAPPPRERQAVAKLPVSGTLIVASSLYGEWRVEAHAQGSLTACGRPERFTIAP